MESSDSSDSSGSAQSRNKVRYFIITLFLIYILDFFLLYLHFFRKRLFDFSRFCITMIMIIWYISYEIHKTVEKEDDILVKFLISSKMQMEHSHCAVYTDSLMYIFVFQFYSFLCLTVSSSLKHTLENKMKLSLCHLVEIFLTNLNYLD